MTIFNFGSIVSDNFYRTPRIPAPGESVRVDSYKNGLGGKGANQSIAAKKAGSDVIHIGAVGYDGDELLDILRNNGVNTENIHKTNIKTGHAISQLIQAVKMQLLFLQGLMILRRSKD